MIFLYYVYSHTINISFAGHFTHPGCENGEDVYNFLSLQELILQPFDLLGADVAYCISSFPKTKEEFFKNFHNYTVKFYDNEVIN